MRPSTNHSSVGRRRRATTSASSSPFIDKQTAEARVAGSRRLQSTESIPLDTSSHNSPNLPFADISEQRRRSFSPLFRKSPSLSPDNSTVPYPNAREDLTFDAPSWFIPRSRRSSRAFASPPPPESPPRTKQVIETHTINKEYDPLTGKKMINEYLIVRELGRGVHGKVKLAEDMERGCLVAIKVVDKESRRRQLGVSLRGSLDDEDRPMGHNPAEQKIQKEIAILKKCVHPHVVRLQEVIDDPASRKIYMVLEYMEGGEIQWRDDEDHPILTTNEARAVFRNVVSGLDYLHYQGIIHRDIKPANLLLTSDRVVKISDFGVSYFSELLAGDVHSYTDVDDAASRIRIARELAKTAGSPAFFAPELCTVGDETASRITKAIDVWALGVTLYCLVFGKCPFEAETEYELFKIIPTQELEFPPETPVEDGLKDLLCKLLAKDVDQRITLEQVRNHPWVTADLEDPGQWKEEADPRRYKAVEVTDEEVSRAVTITEKIRRGIQRLSSSISHFTQAFDMKRRGKSLSNQGQPSTTKPTPDKSTPELVQSPDQRSGSASPAIPEQVHVAKATQVPEPVYMPPPANFQTLETDEVSSQSGFDGNHDYDEQSSTYYDDGPWPLERKDSSASTLSGLVIGRQRPANTETTTN
ncbi:hypothetical protein NQZ79_g5205 [Umbelopsis isabellina]|nr:hypothetical protein NQZ79_g5205 [Umbelopsis isabellina]